MPVPKQEDEQEDRPPSGVIPNPTPQIIDAPEISLTPEEIARQRREFAAVEIGEGAEQMVRRAAAKLPLSPPPLTRYLKSSDTWATYVPDGLISVSRWSEILKEAERRFLPVTEPKISRAERMAERSRRKDN
ncbi:hypothetical protein QQZ08_005217 [Neonectria magnoliae]|uniref:Uncharacterized protein n=1 Tax=Neonectria magnoliae TaxID=2732573 RepID=A0ABR1I4C1_9HYPO